MSEVDFYALMGKVDVDSLPFDCLARAAERLRGAILPCGRVRSTEDYTAGDYARDLRIVFGDPTRGVSMHREGDDLTNVFQKVFS